MTRPGDSWKWGNRHDDSPGVAARTPAPGPGCRFPGCGVRFGQWASRRRWAARGPDHARQPRPALSPVTTAPSTKRATRSSASPMGRSGSGGRTAGPCPTSRSRPRCPPIQVQALRAHHRGTRASPPYADSMPRPGWGSAWIWAGQSMSCIPWPREPWDLSGEGDVRPRRDHCLPCLRACPAPMARDPSDRIVALAFLLGCSGL